MVRSNVKFSFPNQWIHMNGLSILRGEEQILKYKGDNYEINYDGPVLIPSEKIWANKPITITNYENLLRNNLAIYSKKTSNRFFRNQMVIYYIARINPFQKKLSRTPDEHYIEWETASNSFRLKGPNTGYMGVGQWVTLNPFNPSHIKNPIRKASNIKDRWSPVKIKRPIKKINIRELPVINCIEENKIICIPDSKDEPVVAAVGERGGGKSFFLNSLKSRAFWHLHKKIADLNDISREATSYCIPWEYDSSFAKQLKLLNEETTPLPAVYLTLNTKEIDEAAMEKEGCGFRISVASETVINDFNTFVKGTSLKLKASEKYLSEIKDEFLECKDMDEIKQVLNGKVKDEELNDKAANAIYTSLLKIYEEKILDKSNGIPSTWRVIRKDEQGNITEDVNYPPLIAALYADLVPVIITAGVKDKWYFPQLFKYWAQDLFKVQSEDHYFRNNKFQIWAFIDEITRIASKRFPTVASEILEEFAQAGRTRRLGMVYATQNYSKVFDTIRQNTRYLFAFAQKKKEAKEIADDFDLGKDDIKQMLNLNTFEVMACTKYKFITYDAEGDRKEEKGPFKGIAIPPLNSHTVPRKVGEIEN